jgi:mannose-6-phosphate isomerase-like protein (cupin superfamily)
MIPPALDGILYTVSEQIVPFTTLDGSEIRELMHPGTHGCQNQSLAEARVPPRGTTRLHKHLRSEEFYHVLSGIGRMTLGERVFAVAAGSTICIKPGVEHKIENTQDQDLILLCCCAPPYSHADTIVL